MTPSIGIWPPFLLDLVQRIDFDALVEKTDLGAIIAAMPATQHRTAGWGIGRPSSRRPGDWSVTHAGSTPWPAMERSG